MSALRFKRCPGKKFLFGVEICFSARFTYLIPENKKGSIKGLYLPYWFKNNVQILLYKSFTSSVP